MEDHLTIFSDTYTDAALVLQFERELASVPASLGEGD